MSAVNALSKSDPVALKQRLAGLNAGQRALLARRLGEEKSKAASRGESRVIPRAQPLRMEEHPRVAVYPASRGQQRMWFLHHYAPGSPVYCSPSAFHLVGPLNVAWLEAAFGAVIQRHDMLRTTFAMENGELFQRVAVSSAFQLRQINLEAIPADIRKASAERCLAEESCRPFDLAAGPLFRPVLIRLQPTEHVLLLVLHHIISDGWSRSNFYRELAAAYQTLASGRPATVRKLPVQFADYSAWQEDWLEGGALKTQTAYWKTKLAGEPEPLELPSDRARPATESFRGGRCSRRLDPQLTTALKTRAQEEGATLFMILLAAFKTLLHRYTGHDDLIVGVPIANRQRVEVEGLIGFFANTLVMRTTFPYDFTFRELLRSVKQTALEAYANQDMPFERLVELLHVRRDASRTPLFQASFAIQDYPAVNFRLPGIETSPWFVTTRTSKFDFSMTLERSAEGWTAVAEYSTDLFDADRVERMLEHWRVILENVVANPIQRVSEIPLLTAAERQQILVEWNRTERDYPRDKCLHHLFEEQVERTPDAVAVVFEDQRLTYRQLNVRATQLGHYLRSLGVGPEMLVGICVERSLELLVGILGILKAGGAYVPLDPTYPAERTRFVLEDARVPVLLTLQQLRADLGAEIPSCTIVCLDTDWETIAEAPTETPHSGVGPQNLAYVIYTSGSTGKPKGVAIEHHSPVTLVHWAQEIFSPEECIGVLFGTSICFDLSVFEMFVPLSRGGKIILAENALQLPDLPASGEVTLVNTVPSAINELMRRQVLPSSVRTVCLAGEPLVVELVKQVYQFPSVRKVYDLYGPTEAATYSTSALRRVNGPRTIGRPFANTQVYLLDQNEQPVPVGLPGQIYIGGDGLARGYLNRPELTAEKFIADPFSSRPGARLYKTGDLARYFPDGNIEFIGRLDHQVKIRGFRIELGEIEAVLCRHPDLSACAVVTQNEGGGDKTLAAFVVGREQSEMSIGTLRQWLGEKLPDYMIPSRFFVLPALPLTPSGKVDRKALEKMDGVELAAGTDYVPPRNDLESKLAEIWQDVLRRDLVGIHDNFFELGGHSLLAMSIGSQIIRRLNIEIPLRWLLEYPTIEKLARQMESQPGLSQNNRPIEKSDRRQPLPMSFAQQGMWLLQQTLPDLAAYNVPVAFRLSGRMDRERVRRALQAIVERHEVLRTALVQNGESLVQQVAAAKDVPLPWLEVDLLAVPPSQKQSVLEERLLGEARRPFDLAQAPLWRIVWIKLAEDEHVLGITFHHSIEDERTLRLFFQEWERLYAADGELELAGLPELPVQYADFATWQRQRLTGELLEQQRRYWREQLQELPPVLELPTDMARPIRLSGWGAVYDFRLTGPVVMRLRELAREEGTTLFTVLLTAFQVWLHRYTGQTDVIVSTPITNRERTEIQSLLGLFLNTLPIRVRLDGSSGFRQVLRQVRESLLGAFSHADLPFGQMVEMAVKERAPGYQPLCQVMFVLLEEGLPAFQLDQVQARPLPVETRTSKNDLTLFIEAVDEIWNCRFEYATDLFTAETTARMGCHLTELLRSITEDPQKSVSELNLMPAAERHQVLVEWNQTEREYPRNKCIHQLFEEQVERTPEAVAVVFEGKSLTYRELNLRANQLAHHLRTLGVGPDVLVGLCVERSLEMVVALLGILKAGAAYWALEENLPEERLRFLIGDARPKVILTGRKTTGNLAGIATVATVDDLLASPPDRAVCAAGSSSPEDPAYVSYTSGSTGRPKGVVVPHRGVVRLVKGVDYVSLTSEETLLHLSPLSFDASTFELWGALLNGGRVVLLPPGQPSLGEIGETIRQYRVTTLWLTAGLFHLMVDEHVDYLKPLRQLLAGGDVLSPQHVLKARRALAGCRIINGYGPTESTTFTCCYTAADERALAPSIPIGRPIANTQVYVLDASLQPVPVGVPGELYAGGDGVACGYLNQPQLTAERFIPDPFNSRAGARLYRTGDQVRWQPDGNLEFLRRLDSQVKIRGFRVEMGEIETVLCEAADVSEALVSLREDATGEKQLVAYVVASGNREPDQAGLKAALRARLPDYMIPAHVEFLSALPLTPSGKVDRHALPKPTTLTSPAGSAEAMPPRNLLELELIRLWRRLFQREDIGRQDNFFELGGHSLLAARLATEIDKLLGRKLPIAALFQSPTVESLTRRLTRENWAPSWSSLVPLQPAGSQPPLFFAHGVLGDVYVFLELAKLLPSDQPSYGIQAVGLDGNSARHVTVEDMAAHYVKEILSFQRDGPFYLAGYSMGGLIAFEMARQLHRLGERVALLALLDSAPIGKISWFAYGLSMSYFIPRRCLFHFRHWWELPRRERLNYFRGRWAALRYWMVRNRSKPRLVAAPLREDSEPPQVPGFYDYYHAIASAYRVHPYPGSADVFVSDGINPFRWYWRYLARGGVSFHRVPGMHEQLLKPSYLPALAKALGTVLHRAQEKERATHSRNGKTHANLVS
ncbi:MAG: non-ribosomal peptide synthetase [Verrucomicrobia bacterium]|nr:MAG: non-ribosomal peptide synthetase [Verrucomicrobiota bacterium]